MNGGTITEFTFAVLGFWDLLGVKLKSVFSGIESISGVLAHYHTFPTTTDTRFNRQSHYPKS